MNYIFSLFVFFIFLVYPIILGIRNWYFTFTYPKLSLEEREKSGYRKHSVKSNDIVLILFGILCTAMYLTGICLDVTSSDYDVAIAERYYHVFLNTQYSDTVMITLALGLIGLFVITISSPEKMPPVPQALCFAFAAIGEIVFFLLIIHLAKNFGFLVLPLLYYLFNLVLITARVTKRYITERLSYVDEHDTVYIHESAKPIEKALRSVSSLTELHFLMILPAAVILIALFILLGQGPDGIIKAFTMTADWTFSTQIPPPPVEYEGHYLCTVAAGGHKKIVKPLRFGKRRGAVIVVNRQLLASNAFEDMIMERTPRFHKAVRGFYDKYGYPVSKHITTEKRADIVYMIMKPMEWLFILCLYTFDTHPENRIAVQYSDYK